MINIFKPVKVNKNDHILKSQKGAALLTVIIFTVVLVSFVIAILKMAGNDTQLSAMQRDSTKAFYLAEAGIEETIWKLNTGDISLDDLNWGEELLLLHEGNPDEYYDVTIRAYPEDDPRRGAGDNPKDWIAIESQGVIASNRMDADGERIAAGKRTVAVDAHFALTQHTTTIYDKAILTQHMITFQGNPGAEIIGGDIHSNYGIDVKGPFTFDGIATTSGVPDGWPDTSYSSLNDLDNTPNGDFSGPENWQPMDIPAVPYDDLKAMAIANGTYFANGYDSKNYSRGEQTFTGIVYVEGDVIFRNGDSLIITDGALIVCKNNPDNPNDSSGTVEFKNGSNLTIQRSDPIPEGAYPGPLGLAAMGNILLHASSSAVNGVVQSGGYYDADGNLMPGGMVDFRNNSRVVGAVVAEEVWMHNNTTIEYDGEYMENFQHVTTIGNEKFVKVSWREI